MPAARQDKYEPDINEFWIDTETSGINEKENEEILYDRTSTEGTGNAIDLGLTDVDLGNGQEDDGETDKELDEDDDDGGNSTRSRAPCEQQSALEARLDKRTICIYIYISLFKIQANISHLM